MDGGWTGECEGRQPWGDIVGGVVERGVCEVFMACNLVELCVKEQRVRRTSIPESQWDGMCAQSGKITKRSLSRANELWLLEYNWRIHFTVRRLK